MLGLGTRFESQTTKRPKPTSQTISSGQIITTINRRLVTLNGGLVRESPQNPRNIQV